jgi:hypothetical protein
MPLEYENRMGHLYYLHEGKTRTGKPRYYMSRNLEGNPIESVPEGYEIHELPERAQVVLRKVTPTAIKPSEREQVEQGLRKYAGLNHFIVDAEEHSLVVYLPSISEDESAKIVAELAGPLLLSASRRLDEKRERLVRCSPYEKTLRFILTSLDPRLFVAERWCYRSSIEGWISLHGSAPLSDLVKRYATHLGKDSFFELT